jgi:hypothetical protein
MWCSASACSCTALGTLCGLAASGRLSPLRAGSCCGRCTAPHVGPVPAMALPRPQAALQMLQAQAAAAQLFQGQRLPRWTGDLRCPGRLLLCHPQTADHYRHPPAGRLLHQLTQIGRGWGAARTAAAATGQVACTCRSGWVCCSTLYCCIVCSCGAGCMHTFSSLLHLLHAIVAASGMPWRLRQVGSLLLRLPWLSLLPSCTAAKVQESAVSRQRGVPASPSAAASGTPQCAADPASPACC